MADIAISIASKIGELLVKPIADQFRHMCCFNKYVEDLKEEENKLEIKKSGVHNKVEEARRNAYEIDKYAEEWLMKAGKTIEDVQSLKKEIEKKKRCCFDCCPNWAWQYQLSKTVEAQRIELEKHEKKGEFKKVGYRNPVPQAMEFLPNKDFMEFSSRKSALEQILEAIKDDNISMIGLYGVGGVGKSTLAKEVGKHAIELKKFNVVLMIDVSETPDPINIQGQISEKLGLSLNAYNDKGVRAGLIWSRLKSEEKILIILDDVWNNFDLKVIKIPFQEHNGCKILLTTRDQNVCTFMECQRMIEIHELSEHEAWALFKANASLDDESPLKEIAMEVAKWCNGLPETIVTTGKHLKGKNRDKWDAALKKSKQQNFENDHNQLKFSFDQLNNRETRLIFSSLRIAIKSIYNGKYLRCVNEESEVHGFLKFSANGDSSPLTKFEVEPACTGKGLVHLKSCYNNKYVMRWSTNHWWMVAQAEEPEEDVSKWSCTLFQPKFNDELHTVQFIHVQLGHYVCLWRLQEPYGNCLFAGAPHSDQDRCDVYKVFQLDAEKESLV